VKNVKKITLVLTTINVPFLVKDYLENFSEFGWNDVEIIIIGDKKSPEKEIRKWLEGFRDKSVIIRFISINEQDSWMEAFPRLSGTIPYNSDNRRNVGYLMALQHGADIIISLDDDNYPTSEDFIQSHYIVGDTVTLPTIKSSNGWFNACSLLKNDKNVEIYPRGFPYSRRFEPTVIDISESTGKIAINMGLWVNDPDVDAITNLAVPVKVIGLDEIHESVMIDKGVSCPIDSQNTAISRTAMAAYYFVIMGGNVAGTMIDRFGDIWQGYFAKKIIDAMDERITIGKPLADHRRNKHDILKDMQNEMWGIITTEKLVSWLSDIDIENTKSYADAYSELINKLDTDMIKLTDSASMIRYFRTMVDAMRAWIETYEELA